VCPWNKYARACRDTHLAERGELVDRPLRELARLDDAGFRKMFAGTPVRRTGRDRFLRNVLIAIGNSGNRALVGEALRLLDDPAPLVRGMAVWAARRLVPHSDFVALAKIRGPGESDAHVRAEWAAAEAIP
jgi:epoxyqueuosine reductase